MLNKKSKMYCNGVIKTPDLTEIIRKRNSKVIYKYELIEPLMNDFFDELITMMLETQFEYNLGYRLGTMKFIRNKEINLYDLVNEYTGKLEGINKRFSGRINFRDTKRLFEEYGLKSQIFKDHIDTIYINHRYTKAKTRIKMRSKTAEKIINNSKSVRDYMQL